MKITDSDIYFSFKLFEENKFICAFFATIPLLIKFFIPVAQIL